MTQRRVTALLMERLPNGRLIGVDSSAEMIELARVQLGEGAELHHSDLLELDLKLTLVLRKAYGGAVITMNSKGLGADIVFAWLQAEIGIMNAAQSELAATSADQHLTVDGWLHRRGDRARRDA